MLLDLMYPVLGFVISEVMLLAVMALSTAASIGTSLYTSRKAADAQEAVGEANKQRADRDAQQLRKERQAEELAERKAARRRRASIESRYAASGILLQGSAADAVAEQGAVDELNVLNRSRLIENRADTIEDQGRMGLWEASLAASAKRDAGAAQSVNTLFGNTTRAAMHFSKN